MFGKNINFINFYYKRYILNKKKTIKKIYKNLFKDKNQILESLSKSYKDSYNKKLLHRLKKKNQFILIGMGGSILGARAIHSFLSPKFKKFIFVDEFSGKSKIKVIKKKMLI